jgi:hypothetical protein
VSYCFDVLERTWAELRRQLPDSELVIRFELMLHELHSANHRLADKVNQDPGMRSLARELESALALERARIKRLEGA